MLAVVSAILSRFILLVGWSNDSAYWESLFGSQLWLLGGFLRPSLDDPHLGVRQAERLHAPDLIFLGCALLLDLATWGIGDSRDSKTNIVHLS